MKKYILLMFGFLTITTYFEAHATNLNQFEHCNALIRHGMTDVQTKKSSDVFVGYNYHQYCQYTAEKMNNTQLAEAEASIFTFGSGSGSFNRTNSIERINKFCKTNSNIKEKSAYLSTEATKHSKPALDAWNDCQEAAERLVRINLLKRTDDYTELTFEIDSTQDGTLYLTAIKQIGYSCNVFHRKENSTERVSPHSENPLIGSVKTEIIYKNIPINNQNIQVDCSRNQANVSDSVANVKTLKFAEGTVSIFTTGPSFSLTAPEVVDEYHYTPPKSVIAFALNANEQCPPGWVHYKEGYGRFIRGLDPTGKLDDKKRKHSTHQEDTFQQHDHPIGAKSSNHAPGTAAPHGYDSGGYGHNIPKTRGASGNARTSEETRPKNVALLYCLKE